MLQNSTSQKRMQYSKKKKRKLYIVKKSHSFNIHLSKESNALCYRKATTKLNRKQTASFLLVKHK